MDTVLTLLAAAQLPLWLQVVLIALFTTLTAGVGSFAGAYLKIRGTNLATKSDFIDLQNQLRANTELVETIKAEVGQWDWMQREWTNLRRVKLEALLDKLHECEEYLVFCPGNSLTKSREFLEDGVGSSSPYEGL
jgi:hypothetical protein